jgi:hypothetical protein
VFSRNVFFHRRCLGELAELFPELAPSLWGVQSRLIDLTTIACPSVIPKRLDSRTPLGLSAFRQLMHPDTPAMVRHELQLQWRQEHRNRTEVMLRTAQWLAGVGDSRYFRPDRLTSPTLDTDIPPHLKLLFNAFRALLMNRFAVTGYRSFPASIAWLQRHLHGGYSATCALLAWLEDTGIIRRHYTWAQSSAI